MVYDENFEEIRRLFVPSEGHGYARIPLSELVVYNDQKSVSQLMFHIHSQPRPVLDDFTMVVYIDGACRGNGTPTARSSYGVYFGPNSKYNTFGRVPSTMPQTSTRAEIEALSHAMSIIRNVTSQDYRLQCIKIATDSSFLVNAMARDIEGWIVQGGKGARGKKVAHYEKLKELHEMLDEMEFGDDGGIGVQFWLVPRELNTEADALANRALDEA
jgi:ribonuclease HI